MMAASSVLCFLFGSVFASFPVFHIVRELLVGKVPWPLIGFATLAIPFGVFLSYIAVRYMPWALAYRLTIDKSNRAFGYYKNGRWLWRRPLGDITSIITKPGYSRFHWPWAILIQKKGVKEELLVTSFSPLNSEREAFSACSPIAQRIADFLDVPLLHQEWSLEAKSEKEKGA